MEQFYETLRQIHQNDSGQAEKDMIREFILIGVNLPPSPRNILFCRPIRIVNIVYTGTTLTITTDGPHDLIPGDNATVTGTIGILSTPNINGTHTIASATSNTITINISAASGTYTANTGNISSQYHIPFYKQLLAIRPKWEKAIYEGDVSDVEPGTPGVIWTEVVNSFMDSDLISISGTIGQPSGSFYVKKLSPRRLALYNDITLLTPVTLAAGSWEGGGVIKHIIEAQASETRPDQRISASQVATEMDPRYMNTSEGILIRPEHNRPISCKVDYIRTLPISIDASDDVTDLERWYNIELILRVNRETVAEGARRLKDLNDAGAIQNDMNQHPIAQP